MKHESCKFITFYKFSVTVILMNFENYESDYISPRCAKCKDEFYWDDTVVTVNGDVYHEHCVTLVPTSYIALIDGEYLGEVEEDEPIMANCIFDEL